MTFLHLHNRTRRCKQRIHIRKITDKMSDKAETVLETNRLDSAKFEDTVSSILCGLGAQKYIDIFKKQDIDQYGLSELSDEDLIKLGVDEPEVRRQLIEHAKLIPAYDESAVSTSSLGPIEIVEIFDECALLLHRIHLSMVSSNTALNKTKKVSDCLLYKDKYASNIALATLNEMANILNSMDSAVHTHLKTDFSILVSIPDSLNNNRVVDNLLLNCLESFTKNIGNNVKTNEIYRVFGASCAKLKWSTEGVICIQIVIGIEVIGQLKTRDGSKSKKKKIIVGTVGSVVIATLAVLFSRSLKQLQ